jgi:formylmethanofuran dehydrogenase subunit E-like metal-binding protein
MSVYRVLDKLEGYVHEGTWLPAGYRVLSEEKLIEYVEKIRASLPEEVGRAKIITKDQERVLRAAQEKAQAIVDQAATVHEELVDQNEIVLRARATAEAVLRDAEERARKIREGADHYALQVLQEMEGRLASALGSVQKGRQALAQQKAPPVAAAPTQPLADAAARSKRAAFDLEAPDETATLESLEAVRIL